MQADAHRGAHLHLRQIAGAQHLDQRIGAWRTLRGVAVGTQVDAIAVRVRLEQERRGRVAAGDRRRARLQMHIVVLSDAAGHAHQAHPVGSHPAVVGDVVQHHRQTRTADLHQHGRMPVDAGGIREVAGRIIRRDGGVLIDVRAAHHRRAVKGGVGRVARNIAGGGADGGVVRLRPGHGDFVVARGEAVEGPARLRRTRLAVGRLRGVAQRRGIGAVQRRGDLARSAVARALRGPAAALAVRG